MPWQEERLPTGEDQPTRRDHERHVAQGARQLPREPASALPRLVLTLATLAWLATVAWLFVTLPDRVPTHWGTSDTPDGWSSRAGALAPAVLIPLVAAFPMLLLSRLALAWPEGINLPESRKRWWLQTPERLVRFERLLREDLMFIVATVLFVLAGTDVVIGVAAHRPGGEAPTGAFVAILGVALVGVAVVVVRMLVGGRYRPRSEDGQLVG